MRRRLIVFDSTLREGAQIPESLLLISERVVIAQVLEKLNVDVIEAGFAASSREGFLAIQAISSAVKVPVVSSLCRILRDDIDIALQALSTARKMRLHLFLTTSDLAMRYKNNLSRSQLLHQAVAAVEYARKKCADIQFTVKDAGRTDRAFLLKVVSAVIEAGATVVSLSDPVGHCLPEEFGGLVKDVREKVRALDHAFLGVHVRDSYMGLALASTIAAVEAGADQVECTINGIGDGAGICSLEGLVNALKVRQDYFAFVRTDIQEELFPEADRLVCRALGIKNIRSYSSTAFAA